METPRNERAPEIIFMNLLAYAVVYLLLLVVFGNYRWSVFVGTALFYAFALACHFVLSFRGTPFVPLDIISTGTAANVIANYVFALTPQWTAATIQAGLILGVGFQLGRGSLRRVRWKLTLRALAALLIIGTVGTFFSQSYLQERSYVSLSQAAFELRAIWQLVRVLHQSPRPRSGAAGKLRCE